MPTKARIGVLGASGYTGSELVRLLLRHPRVEIALLTADRLTQPAVTAAYVIILGVKITLSLAMFGLALQFRSRSRAPSFAVDPDEVIGGRPWSRSPGLVLVLGLVVYFLAIVLKVQFEAGATGG